MRGWNLEGVEEEGRKSSGGGWASDSCACLLLLYHIEHLAVDLQA